VSDVSPKVLKLSCVVDECEALIGGKATKLRGGMLKLEETGVQAGTYTRSLFS